MKINTSIISKRREYILKYLKVYPDISTAELAEKLNVSSLTLRRDFQALENDGLVVRYYGGAKLIEDSPLLNDINFENNNSLNNENKHKIAKYAADLIEDGDTIFINSSTTALLILEYLEDKRVTVITNNGKALFSNIGPNVDLILTGGQVYERKQSLVGEFATTIFSSVIADKCFIGVNGVSVDFGISTSVFQETLVNKAMINHCKGPVFVLASSSKIGLKNKFLSGSIDDISHLITDSGINETSIKKLEKCGIEIIKV